MKANILPLLFIGISCSCTEISYAQTTNIGEILVSKGAVLSIVDSFNNEATGSFINNGDVYVYSHWNNDGTVNHYDNNGLTRYIGDTTQTITGSSVSFFYDTLFDNNSGQPPFELSGEISVANSSDFKNGIVDNKNFGGSFTFEHNGDQFSTSDNSYVNGRVKKIGKNAFTFPIGDGGFYRKAEISSPDYVSDAFSGNYFLEDPTLFYPLDSSQQIFKIINNQEYWTLTRDLGSSKVFITLSWDENTTTPAAIVVSPETAIHIARWDETKKAWVDEGGVVDASNKTITTTVTLDKYGVFTLARVAEEALLPSEIIIYNGLTPNDDGVNDYFKIKGIENLPNNEVIIYNRWGVEVFTTSNYDTNGNIFKGVSDGRLSFQKNKLLPAGTYFYVLTYDYIKNGSTERAKKVGYLYINLN